MIYVHVPFCKSFCTYCDFYSEICSAKDSARVQKLYADALCAEIDRRRGEIRACDAVRTLYVGGGTPSLLDTESLRRIVEHLDGGPYDEFTVEVNPEDIVERGAGYVSDLLSMGVSRVSMGVQSMDDGLLSWMNRRHDASGARRAVSILREAGVENLSLDLIFGISHMSSGQWIHTIDSVLELSPEHVSAYQLSVEGGSALAAMVAKGAYVEAGDDLCREQYDILCRKLADAGFAHYEVSNFALPGREAVHNSAYWTRVPYVGLGPGAHSFDGVSRSWNSQQVCGYTSQSEMLTEQDAVLETLLLSLRTSRGAERDFISAHCDGAAVSSLMDDGSLVTDGDRVRIPEDRWFVSDGIIRALV